MKISWAPLLLVFFLSGSVSAFTPTPGSRVLALTPSEIYWYPTTVLAQLGPLYEVLMDRGGKRAKLGLSSLREIHLKIGTKVYVRWQGRSDYYPGTITKRENENIRVQYEDGDQEMTTLGRIRVARDDLENYCVRGERVYALIPSTSLWIPAQISNKDKEKLQLNALGIKMDTTVDRVRALQLEIGDRVLCYWQQGPLPFGGRVSKVNGDKVFVKYDDGDEEWTTPNHTHLVGSTEDLETNQLYCTQRDPRHVSSKIDKIEKPKEPTVPRQVI